MLFCLVVGVALAVGVYAIRDPNGMNLGLPWPAVSELIAAAAARYYWVLASGLSDVRRDGRCS